MRAAIESGAVVLVLLAVLVVDVLVELLRQLERHRGDELEREHDRAVRRELRRGRD